MHFQHVNFVSRRRPGFISLTLLIIGIVGCAGALHRWQHQRAEAVQLAAQLERQDKPIAATQLPAAPPDPRHAELRRALLVDWQTLFSALEVPPPHGVQLLSIDPDAATGSVRLSGQAPSIGAAATYLAHLKQAGLQSPRLLSHQALDPAAPAGPVRFTVTAIWALPHG
ncbi:hypothetical protein [Eleftheria terrae]|uniref:hypothetical protein n=1 Tax=Eleftheria terrae TaxID=1597781 RepID=UPI00263A52D7|nr:hypothetical protein [Eleftheria terrae]WKB56142.1 hypothetical protein N7L95_29310 [Eleftheria terrae]